MIRTSVRSVALAALVTLVPSYVSHAQLHSKSGRLIVLTPRDLPEAARVNGNSFFLHASGGGYYLYVEQQSGAQLVIFDVTDPAHIKVKATQRLAVSGPYDFVRPMGVNGELMRFRDGKTVAMLDVSKEGAPEMRDASAMKAQGETVVSENPSSSDGSEPDKFVRPVRHDYEVVDTAAVGQPEHVTTVKQVKQQVVNDDTGTTFLLNSDGLTVIRRTDAEEAYATHKQQLASQ